MIYPETHGGMSRPTALTIWPSPTETPIQIPEIDPRDITKERYVKYAGVKKRIPSGVEVIDWLELSRETWHQVGGEIVAIGVGGGGSDDDDDVTVDLVDHGRSGLRANMSGWNGTRSDSWMLRSMMVMQDELEENKLEEQTEALTRLMKTFRDMQEKSQ